MPPLLLKPQEWCAHRSFASRLCFSVPPPHNAAQKDKDKDDKKEGGGLFGKKGGADALVNNIYVASDNNGKVQPSERRRCAASHDVRPSCRATN